jgi:hypothetical protein
MKSLPLRVPDALHARFRSASFLSGRPIDDLFRDALRDWIEAHGAAVGHPFDLRLPDTGPPIANPDHAEILAEIARRA